MSNQPMKPKNDSPLPKREVFEQQLNRRQSIGRAWQGFFFFSNLFALFVLIILLASILNGVFGYEAREYTVQPSELSERPLTELSEEELIGLLTANNPNQVRVLLRDTLSRVPAEEFTTRPMSDVLSGSTYDPAIATLTLRDLTPEQVGQILIDNLSKDQMLSAIESIILKPVIRENWTFLESVFNRTGIEEETRTEYPEATLSIVSRLNWGFITNELSKDATRNGIIQPLTGTFWVVLVAILFALPIGTGAAIYLQEYATDNWINKFIETNIRNLAGVPSIIYGLLGFFLFVNVLRQFTSGAFLGAESDNSRTLLSGGLTLGLVILPVIIINAREAIRAVPPSLREASFGLGATKWQTVSRVVFPQAFAGIMTGAILGIARAIGETAPLIVTMGAIAFTSGSVTSPFDRSPILPIVIYKWTTEPDAVIQSLVPAAILALLIMLLIINSVAIILRNRFTTRI
jgi:phosphate transport system permease protein